MDQTIQAFCRVEAVSAEEITGRVGRGGLAERRFMLWHYLHTRRGVPYTQISRRFGRSYRGVRKSMKRFKGYLEFTPKTQYRYWSLSRRLDGELGEVSQP